MKYSSAFLTTFVCLSAFLRVNSAKPRFIGDGVNGGIGCAACTILVGMTEQLSIVYNQTIEKSLDDLCNFLPPNSIFKATCLQAVAEFAPAIINGYFIFISLIHSNR